MKIVAIGNTEDNNITWEGSYNTPREAIDELTKKYGEFMEFPIELGENGEFLRVYINNDTRNIFIVDADAFKDVGSVLWTWVPETVKTE